jgi:hypothetical protein
MISQVFGYWLNQVTKILSLVSRPEFFSLQNPNTFSKKKFSRPILRFLTNFEGRYIQFEDLFRKKTSGELLQIFSRFLIFYQKPVRMMHNRFLFFGVKISAFCSSGLRIKEDMTKCGHDLESSRNALQNGILIMLTARTRQEK